MKPSSFGVAILADDLSGAADCAAAFATEAAPVPLYLHSPAAGGRFALDLDSRGAERAAAMAAVEDAVRRSVGPGATGSPLLFKKIDSTLRGHVGAELRAALAVPSIEGAVVCPAFVQQGRTLRGGRLFVHDVARRDAAGRELDLRRLLAEEGVAARLLGPTLPGGPEGLAQAIISSLHQDSRAVVIDAVDQDDLDNIALALVRPGLPRLLIAGSAGLARALAGGPAPRLPDLRLREGRIVAVVGSLSEMAVHQVDALAALPDFALMRCADPEHRNFEGPADGCEDVAIVTGGLGAGSSSRQWAREVARRCHLALASAAALVLTGGDTARAVLESLAVRRLDVLGEFEPGISVCRLADVGPLVVVKAGAFGDPGSLQRVVNWLQSLRVVRQTEGA